MNDYIIACIVEGTAEAVIIEKLLDEDCLIFSWEDLIQEDIIKCRNATEFQTRYLRIEYPKPIRVYRILDSRKENFKLGKAYKEKVKVTDVITSPEIEMLIIHAEGKYKDYCKTKMKPSEYCKVVLKMKQVKSRTFVENYFNNVDKLKSAIKEYSRTAKKRKGELQLIDLFKE